MRLLVYNPKESTQTGRTMQENMMIDLSRDLANRLSPRLYIFAPAATLSENISRLDVTRELPKSKMQKMHFPQLFAHDEEWEYELPQQKKNIAPDEENRDKAGRRQYSTL